MSVSNLSRRAFLGMSGSAVALAGLGLAACGSDSSSSDNANATGTANSTDVTGTEPQNGSPATTPLDQLPLPEKGIPPLKRLHSSDAHYLENIFERTEFLDMSECSPRGFFDYIRSG